MFPRWDGSRALWWHWGDRGRRFGEIFRALSIEPGGAQSPHRGCQGVPIPASRPATSGPPQGHIWHALAHQSATGPVLPSFARDMGTRDTVWGHSGGTLGELRGAVLPVCQRSRLSLPRAVFLLLPPHTHLRATTGATAGPPRVQLGGHVWGLSPSGSTQGHQIGPPRGAQGLTLTATPVPRKGRVGALWAG